ncbi:MAG: glycoside hydrolase family 13 protein [Anaerolineales bacterium]|nr:glycoside hydrolase family 13 protein [Anaerolineales bacterium]
MNTPSWVKNAVFYQIFPDRFARSPRTQHPRGIQFKPWGTSPEEQGYQGGDLYGIVDKLDYLQELGITALYLNPIFSSASNHRYHAFDYMQVDPLLGGDAALRDLLDSAHARGMYVVLDGVLNHASRGFWPFHHVLENGSDSPYIDWFFIDDWPLRPYSSDEKNPANYAAWWGMPALPKLNTNNPGVRDYLFEVTRYWLEFGIDGWRLDVPSEIDDDDFWREYRRVVKAANPRAYIVGEIWTEAQRWLQGDMFDAVMNYLFTRHTLSFFGANTLRKFEHNELPMQPLDAPTFAQQINQMHALYDWEINQTQLNLLDSHDTPRALWLMSDDKSALRLSLFFQMTMPGAPCIYYGDEIGLTSAGDPHCRAAFPWEQESIWDHDLLDFYKQVIALRHQNSVLRTGSFEIIYAEGDVLAFRRILGERRALVVFNTGLEAARITVTLPGAQQVACYQAWPQGGGSYQVENSAIFLVVPARDALVLFN